MENNEDKKELFMGEETKVIDVKRNFTIEELVNGMLGISKKNNLRRYQILNALSNFFHKGIYSLSAISEKDASKNFYKDQPHPQGKVCYKLSAYHYFKNTFTKDGDYWFNYYGLKILPDMWAYHIKNCIENENYLFEVERIEEFFEGYEVDSSESFLKVIKNVDSRASINIKTQLYDVNYDVTIESCVDIETAEALYYIDTEHICNTSWGSLYLNILNLKFGKKFLHIIHATENGEFSVSNVTVLEKDDVISLVAGSLKNGNNIFTVLDKHSFITFKTPICLSDYIENVIKNKSFLLCLSPEEWASIYSNEPYIFLDENSNEKEYRLKVALFFKELFTILRQLSLYYPSTQIYAFLQEIKINRQKWDIRTLQNEKAVKNFFCKDGILLSEDGIILSEDGKFFYEENFLCKEGMFCEKIFLSEDEKSFYEENFFFKKGMGAFEGAIKSYRASLGLKEGEEGKKRIDFIHVKFEGNFNRAQVERIHRLLYSEGLASNLLIKEGKVNNPRFDVTALDYFYKKVDAVSLPLDITKSDHHFLKVAILDAVPYSFFKEDRNGDNDFIQIKITFGYWHNNQVYTFVCNYNILNALVNKRDNDDINYSYFYRRARELNLLFDSFGIERGDFNFAHWKGKEGYISFDDEDFDIHLIAGILPLKDKELIAFPMKKDYIEDECDLREGYEKAESAMFDLG